LIPFAWIRVSRSQTQLQSGVSDQFDYSHPARSLLREAKDSGGINCFASVGLAGYRRAMRLGSNHAVGDYVAQNPNQFSEPPMSKSAFLTARIEPKLKARASRVLAKVGLSTTDAITMFLSQVVLRGGLPFDARVPNSAIGTAIAEFEAGRAEGPWRT
jgi:DNA-damage-inducible protein J